MLRKGSTSMKTYVVLEVWSSWDWWLLEFPKRDLCGKEINDALKRFIKKGEREASWGRVLKMLEEQEREAGLRHKWY